MGPTIKNYKNDQANVVLGNLTRCLWGLKYEEIEILYKVSHKITTLLRFT